MVFMCLCMYLFIIGCLLVFALLVLDFQFLQELCFYFHWCRRYPTVEKRAKVFNGASYVPVPEDGPSWKHCFWTEIVGWREGLLESRDSCSHINKTSIYGLRVGSEELWPVVAFLKNGMIYACVPLVEQRLSLVHHWVALKIYRISQELWTSFWVRFSFPLRSKNWQWAKYQVEPVVWLAFTSLSFWHFVRCQLT